MKERKRTWKWSKREKRVQWGDEKNRSRKV